MGTQELDIALAGWWFGTWLLFLIIIIWDVILPIAELMYFSGWLIIAPPTSHFLGHHIVPTNLQRLETWHVGDHWSMWIRSVGSKITGIPLRGEVFYMVLALVGGFKYCLFSISYMGMSSSQVTNSIIFQRGWLKPSTRACIGHQESRGYGLLLDFKWEKTWKRKNIVSNTEATDVPFRSPGSAGVLRVLRRGATAGMGEAGANGSSEGWWWDRDLEGMRGQVTWAMLKNAIM